MFMICTTSGLVMANKILLEESFILAHTEDYGPVRSKTSSYLRMCPKISQKGVPISQALVQFQYSSNSSSLWISSHACSIMMQMRFRSTYPKLGISYNVRKVPRTSASIRNQNFKSPAITSAIYGYICLKEI